MLKIIHAKANGHRNVPCSLHFRILNFDRLTGVPDCMLQQPMYSCFKASCFSDLFVGLVVLNNTEDKKQIVGSYSTVLSYLRVLQYGMYCLNLRRGKGHAASHKSNLPGHTRCKEGFTHEVRKSTRVGRNRPLQEGRF